MVQGICFFLCKNHIRSSLSDMDILGTKLIERQTWRNQEICHQCSHGQFIDSAVRFCLSPYSNFEVARAFVDG